MIQGIQNFLEEAGEAGCYVLSLASVAVEAERLEVDIVSVMLRGVSAGFIHYNSLDSNDNDNFFVNDPSGFLGLMTGHQWEVRKEGPQYCPSFGEYEIDRWERVKTGHTSGHFNRPNWEPYIGSLTVKYGAIVSKRICKRIG